jgi:hypothetical protein
MTRHLSGVELTFISLWIVATALCLSLALSVLWMPDSTVAYVLGWCCWCWRSWTF